MPDKITFYLDENIANEVANGLRNYAIDVITTPEAGHLGFSDEQHLEFALAENHVFVTEDEDFLMLHSAGAAHAGIVYYKHRSRSVKEVIRGLVLIFEVLTPDDMLNHIEYL